MRTQNRYQKQNRAGHFYTWVLVLLFLLLNFLLPTKTRCENSNKFFFAQPKLTRTRVLSFTDKSTLSNLIDFSSQFPIGQLITKHNSHPLSSGSFSKTRPRGILAQRPDFKNIYLPGHSIYSQGFSKIYWLGIYKQAFYIQPLESHSIRPPPSTTLYSTRRIS
jgi:hypothetical protein